MPVPTDITAGTLTLTNGSTAVTGTGTAWLASALRQGDVIIWAEGADGFQMPILADVPSSQTALTLVNPWPGPTLTDVAYRIRFQWDSSRVSGQIRQLTDRLDNGNIVAFTGLEGPGVPVFDGPHSMTIRPLNEFISGVTVDARVQTLAERAAYDAQAANFSVYVNDIGDGRAAVYFKLSATSGNWSTPAYQTGPVGPAPNVEATVTSIASDQTATVTETPIVGGVRLDFNLPRSDGFRNMGAYNAANAYVKDDVVTSNGSTFIALQAVPAGTAPSSAFPPVDTAFWQVLTQRGANGTGTGDVVGPAVSVDGRIVEFDGTTGKLLKDGGVAISPFMKTLLDDLTASASRTTLAAFGVIRIQILTVSGNYTPHANMLFADVELQAAGGGGAGSTSGTGQNAGGTGGSGGGNCKRRFSRAALGTLPVAVSLGAVGFAGSPGLSGGAAGNSTFGSFMTAGGGQAGTFSGPVSTASSAVGISTNDGGTATGGDINTPGEPGGSSIYPALAQGALSGKGGSSALGFGGAPVNAALTNGKTGTGFGSGGSGGSTSGVQNANGASGRPGVCIIIEYCSE